MPVVKQKNGLTCNTDRIFGVEARIIYPYKNYVGSWFEWRKYKTQREMLQGLKDLREVEPRCRIKRSEDGGKTYHETIWEYRPVHVYYDL